MLTGQGGAAYAGLNFNWEGTAMARTVNFFAGANSGDGFRNLFHEIVDLEATYDLMILKGGPGVGKNTFMREIGRTLEQTGTPVEYLWCSGDPDSLDGVVLPEVRCAVVDGTSPHVLEPRYPAAVDRYVDLGRFYDLSAAKTDAEAVKTYTHAYQAAYVRAYHSLKAARQVELDAVTAVGKAFDADRARRDFRRMDGVLRLRNGNLVHGPHKKEVREYFLRRLLEVERLVHEIGPEEVRNTPLITMDELRLIRQIWLDGKHEFEDTLPGIYESVTGKPYDDGTIRKNKYFGAPEGALLREVCQDAYPQETLLYEMGRALLDIEAKASAISNHRSIVQNFEKEIKKDFYSGPEEAEQLARARADRASGMETSFTDEHAAQ